MFILYEVKYELLEQYNEELLYCTCLCFGFFNSVNRGILFSVNSEVRFMLSNCVVNESRCETTLLHETLVFNLIVQKKIGVRRSICVMYV